MAWDAFERKNGVASLDDLILRVRRYRVDDRSIDPVIGCNVLAEPFFLPRSEWIPVPSTWALNIVQGKTYESDSEEGRKLWSAVQERITLSQRVQDAGSPSSSESDRRFGAEYLAQGRLGQGAFLKAEWENGREYYAYHGKELMCRPTDAASFPSREFLQWHNENTFKA